MVTPNLTKENFWADLENKFPDAVQIFKKWIDAYKVSVNWDLIFCNNPGTGQSMKFHDLPFEIQNGIMARFMIERMNDAEGNGEKYYQRGAVNYRDHLTTLFGGLQSAIIKKRSIEN